MKKNITILFFLLNFCSNIFADEVVTLTVNGQGQTKEQATTNALRSAIEQTFGAHGRLPSLWLQSPLSGGRLLMSRTELSP